MKSISHEKQVELYVIMYRIRRVEETLVDLFYRKLYPGYIHSSIGQEACAAGVCAALRAQDYVISNHRARAHIVAKGMALRPMMAEMLGRTTGISGGRGGEMHAADPSLGILGGNGIVGGGIPISIGTGFSAIVRGTDQVTAVFFGEGASTTGGLHEALNLASAWSLPILFVCENNMYMEMTAIKDVVKNCDIAHRAHGYGIPGEIIDGNDVRAVYASAEAAVARARNSEGPSFLELKTYRWGGHFEGDPCKYRTREEEEEWKARCPVKRSRKHLRGGGLLSAEKLEALEKAVDLEVADALQFALDSPLPEPEEALQYVYAE
ncbi:MAG: thiamine pyrophosphate-dependent dehydrogenase E1 component subunit alpha [Pseudomonadota bacterium]